MAEIRNIVRKKDGARGAYSRGFVRRIGVFFLGGGGDATQVAFFRCCFCASEILIGAPAAEKAELQQQQLCSSGLMCGEPYQLFLAAAPAAVISICVPGTYYSSNYGVFN